MNDQNNPDVKSLKDINMTAKGPDMFGIVTIELSQPVKLIEDFNVNIFRDINPSNLHLEIIPALFRDEHEGFNPDSIKMNWTISNQTNLTAGIIKI